MKIRLALSLLLFSLISCTDNSSINLKIPVTGGLIEGYADGNLKKYLGIPYAAAPINELRWAPTQELEEWDGVLPTKSHSKICYQPKQITEFYDDVPDLTVMSEDCLTLNVWTRADQVEDNLPVMVWIHGGALVWGTGSEYSGEALTKKGVVIVTLNYRLGPLGFFSHPELSRKYGSSGNQGYRDQIQALKWVKDNISMFGGNPNNITIFGESAGSWSVNVLQASPLARGLFHKVIGQSGARLIPLTHNTESSVYSDSGEDLGINLSRVMAQKNNPNLTDLRDLSAITIIENIENDPLYLTQFDSLTVIDGDVIPEDISSIFKKGNQADVPVLIGSTADEATTFDPKVINPDLSSDLSYSDLTRSTINEILPSVDKRIFDLYPTYNEEISKVSWVDFTTDSMFTAQMQKWGTLMSSVDSNTYLYFWNWHPTINGSKNLKAFHAAEVPYVFGQFDMFNMDVSSDDNIFSELMMTIWTNFAKYGDPSIKGQLDWPEFNSSSEFYVVLDSEVEIKKSLRKEKLTLINEAYDLSRPIYGN